MEVFETVILGCGSATPTPIHLPSCQVVNMRGKLFMVDCGEGAQLSFRQQKLNMNDLQAIFISHLHGDHCFGVPGLISTLSMLGRTQSLHIYAPDDYETLLQPTLDFFCKGLEFEVVYHRVNPQQTEVVYEDRTVTVRTLPLQHRLPCCGYLFEEHAVLPHIRKDMIDFLHIPVFAIRGIKEGQSWTDENGRVWTSEELTRPSYAPRTYAYCSDTMYFPELANTLKTLHPEGLDLLYHEATFAEEHKSRCKETFHSTARQAARIACDSGAKKLLIGHYSARYNDSKILLDEAKTVFPNTFAANEGLKFEI